MRSVELMLITKSIIARFWIVKIKKIRNREKSAAHLQKVDVSIGFNPLLEKAGCAYFLIKGNTLPTPKKAESTFV